VGQRPDGQVIHTRRGVCRRVLKAEPTGRLEQNGRSAGVPTLHRRLRRPHRKVVQQDQLGLFGQQASGLLPDLDSGRRGVSVSFDEQTCHVLGT
jgi:hypothetical protein